MAQDSSNFHEEKVDIRFYHGRANDDRIIGDTNEKQIKLHFISQFDNDSMSIYLNDSLIGETLITSDRLSGRTKFSLSINYTEYIEPPTIKIVNINKKVFLEIKVTPCYRLLYIYRNIGYWNILYSNYLLKSL